MHLRRALLLFAIVLGLAALAAGLSRPAERARAAHGADRGRARAGDQVAPGAGRAAASAPLDPRRRSLAADQAAEVLVERAPARPGGRYPGLGLSASADAVTPARFDVLEHRPGRYPILFAPAGGDEATDAERGTLVTPATAPEAGFDQLGGPSA